MLRHLIILLSTIILLGCHSETNVKKIGIIVPIEHKALNEIVAGFTESLKADSPYPLKFKIANAQGDMNLERAIIQQMKDENYDLVVPIGTDATQMSGAIIHKQPIVSLGASFSQKEREQRKSCNIAIVHDEISSALLLQFIHNVYPQLNHMVLIHSTSEKIFPEVTNMINTGKQYGMTIKPMMVPTLNELYSTANNMPANTQAILLLKDNLIVSGISTLKIAADKRHIPLITSDQGSVQEGASFALGVHERQIGVEGAKLATAILAGKSPCSLPIVDMTKLTVFINKNSLITHQNTLNQLESVSKKLNYTIENTNNRG